MTARASSQFIRERVALSVTETCCALGVSRSTVYRLINDGRLRPVHLGRRVLIPLSELDRLMSSGKPDPTES
ncbi:MAG: helix-turn-helix domain-containing protein [Acidimicrobiia bacterium]